MSPALEIRDLTVTYPNGAHALRGLDLTVSSGVTALVGESGCGKSTVASAVLGLLPRRTRVEGSLRVTGVEVVGADPAVLRALRGKVVGLVPQDPVAACDPLRRVGHHVAESWRAHGEPEPPGGAAELLARLGVAADRLRQRPHQWSGGMLHRATIAAAVAHRPALLVADEPTSSLDAEHARRALDVLRSAADAVLLISHDLGVVRAHADRVAISYAGRVVETGAAEQVLTRPGHPYTRALVAAIPTPGAGLPTPLPGAPPRAADDVVGCAFAARCPLADARCAERPQLAAGVACWQVRP